MLATLRDSTYHSGAFMSVINLMAIHPVVVEAFTKNPKYQPHGDDRGIIPVSPHTWSSSSAGRYIDLISYRDMRLYRDRLWVSLYHDIS